MRDIDDRLLCFLPYAGKLLLQLPLGDRVESGEWLVHEQDLWLDDQRPRNLNTLLHSARELERKFFACSSQADHA